MHVIVHGGAGDEPDDPPDRAKCLDEAAEAGATAEEPLDAVERAVRVLEASPEFNAGVGGCVQSDGIVRTDAGVMTGSREIGAACSMPGVEAAVSVARYVLEATPHVLVAGVHAVDLAAAAGIDTEVDLLTDETQRRFESAGLPDGRIDEQLAWVRERFGDDRGRRDDPEGRDHDTVGAVAVDDGRVAAATSTGGRWFALSGRVGDVPQVGCGFYASPAGGASATGYGEDIARATLAREAVRRLEDGETAPEAAEGAIDEFEATTGSQAGLIVADAAGTVGSAHCATSMTTASAMQ